MNRLIHFVTLSLLLLAVALLTTGCGAGDEGDQATFGSSRLVRADQTIEGDYVLLGGTVHVEEGAVIEGDVAIFGATFTLDGTVEGNIANFGGTIWYGPNAKVGGEVALIGGSEHERTVARAPTPPAAPDAAAVPDAAEAPDADAPESPAPPPIARTTTRVAPSLVDRLFGFVGYVVGTIMQTIAFGVMGLVLTLFMPDHVRRVGQTAEHAPVESLAVGCVTFPAVAVLMVLALITLIGIPITILLPFLTGAAIIFGWIGIGFFIGQHLLRAADVRSPRPAAAAAIGSGGLYLASSIINTVPLMGLITPVLLAWSLGATVLTRGGTQPYPKRLKVADVPPTPVPDPLDELEPTPAPAGRSNLFADLAADLGIEDEIYGEDDTRPNRPETPVPPPDDRP